MNIEKENSTFKQIESFIRNVNEKEWDNPIEKIKKFKKYYQVFPKINYCTHSQTIHKESCVSFKITSTVAIASQVFVCWGFPNWRNRVKNWAGQVVALVLIVNSDCSSFVNQFKIL